MSFLQTYQDSWQILNQGTVNAMASNAITADVNTYALAYGETWTTTLSVSGGACAQNPVNKPSLSKGPFPIEYNGFRFRFLVADTAVDEVALTIWSWDMNGAARDMLVINPVRAGTSVCDASPVNGASLIHLAFSSGGTAGISVGDTIVGATGAATAIVDRVDLVSGTWAGGDAAGQLYLSSIVGTFESENLNIGGINGNILYFNSGGTAELKAGYVITGATSGATATVVNVSVTSGNWAAGTAAGTLEIAYGTGTFSASENLNVTMQSNIATLTVKQANIATIGGDVTHFYYADVATVTKDNCNVVEPGVTANGIKELEFDGKGITHLFADGKIDAVSGTTGSDWIVLFKGF